MARQRANPQKKQQKRNKSRAVLFITGHKMFSKTENAAGFHRFFKQIVEKEQNEHLQFVKTIKFSDKNLTKS